MGRIFLEHIGDGAPSHLFCCVKCSTVVTSRSELVTPSDTSALGSAFLFETAVNLCFGDVYDMSRHEKIRDAKCKKCGLKLGWFFEFVSEEAERYKEGRVLLERNLVVQLYE